MSHGVECMTLTSNLPAVASVLKILYGEKLKFQTRSLQSTMSVLSHYTDEKHLCGSCFF